MYFSYPFQNYICITILMKIMDWEDYLNFSKTLPKYFPSHAIMFTKITLFIGSLKKWRRNASAGTVSNLWKELQWLGINDSNGVGWVPLQRIIGISLPHLCVVFVELSLITVMSSSTLCPETQLRCYVFGLHYE